MAIVTGGPHGSTNDLYGGHVGDIASGTASIVSSTKLRITNIPVNPFDPAFRDVGFVEITGTGFTFNGTDPTGGTVTGYSDGTGLTVTGISIPLTTVWTAIASGSYDALESQIFAGNDTITATGDGLSASGGNRYCGYGGNDTFNMQALTNAGTYQLFGGDGNDTFNFGGGFGWSSEDWIDGGSGTDTLNLNGDYYPDDPNSMGYSVKTNGVEIVHLATGHSYKLYLEFQDWLPTDAQIVTIDGSALGASNVMYINTSSFCRILISVLGGAGNDTLTGGAQADTFDLSKGGNDTVKGLDGNDTFNLGAKLTASDKIDGGAGTDTLNLNGNYAAGVTFSSTTLVNVEKINLAAGHSYKLTTNDATVASGQKLTVSASSLAAANTLNFNGSAETDGKFAITGGAGNDTLTGGVGADSFDLSKGGDDTAQGLNGNDTFNLGAALTASDKIDGGAGTDTLNLNGNYASGVTFGSTTLVNVEKINIAAGHSYKLTTNDVTVASGQTLTVNASALAAANTLNFNGSAETNGKFVIIGGAGNDRLTGGAGADKITGSGGADHLKGGAGADTFVYSAVSDSTSTNYDTITGFDASSDKIDTWFSVTGVDTALTSGALSSGSGFDTDLAAAVGAASLAAHHAVEFTPNSGSLSGHHFLVVDVNGSAGYQAGADLVIELVSPTHTSLLGIGTFT